MNFYKILGVRKTATPEEIRTAYKSLAKMYHPDVYKGDKVYAEKKMQEINQANDVLSDPKKREYYDLTLNDGDRPEGRGNSRAASKRTDIRRKTTRVKIKKKKKTASQKRTGIPGNVETWRGALGYSALAISFFVWVFSIMVSGGFMNLYMIITFTGFCALYSYLYCGRLVEKNIDVGSFGIMVTLSYCSLYYLIFITLRDEPESFNMIGHLIFLPMHTTVIAYLPSNLSLLIIRKIRHKRSLSKKET